MTTSKAELSQKTCRIRRSILEDTIDVRATPIVSIIRRRVSIIGLYVLNKAANNAKGKRKKHKNII